jgi:hypothetical protein
MRYKAKVAVCSEIRTKHINAMWAPCRILECRTWWYVKLPLGFKRLICLSDGSEKHNPVWSVVADSSTRLHGPVTVQFIVFML